MDMFDEQRLLDYATYDDYLDSFVTRTDLCYMRSTYYGRQLAELGYRSTTGTHSKAQFYARKAAVQEALFPTRKAHAMLSAGIKTTDSFLQELALRERSNRLRMLSTIIYVSHHTATGYEISGYIDFEQSMRQARQNREGAADWYGIFNGTRRLWPSTGDLGYFHWRTGRSVMNNTDNYKPISDPIGGLCFICRHDRKLIRVDPTLEVPGSNTTRTVVQSERYEHVVLYDHLMRLKN